MGDLVQQDRRVERHDEHGSDDVWAGLGLVLIPRGEQHHEDDAHHQQ
jgi:hypothetical protein